MTNKEPQLGSGENIVCIHDHKLNPIYLQLKWISRGWVGNGTGLKNELTKLSIILTLCRQLRLSCTFLVRT